MEDILFVGPVAHTGGPAIKNRILVEHLQKRAAIKVWNTYDKSIKARLGAIKSILFAKQKHIIIAVSRKGRNLLYPFMRFKAKISGCKYSCVIIGGQAVESFTNQSSIKALHDADIVTVETEGLKAQMEKAFNLNNVYWMPNYKELNNRTRTVSGEDLTKSVLRMVFLSSMRDLKGVKTLVEAYKRCCKEGVQVELDFYGPIKEDFDKSLLGVIDEMDGMRYCGEAENDVVLDIMAQYQVFVFPTECDHEGFPAVLVEAMSVGLPIIASDVSYNEEIIEDQVNGFIFPHGNVQRLLEAIKYCADHREELKKISQKNIATSRMYDASAVIDAYADELEKSGWPI